MLVISKLRFYPGANKLFSWLVDRLRSLQKFREDSHYDLTRPLSALQDIVRIASQRLVDRGIISTNSDVYYLTPVEFRTLMTGDNAVTNGVRIPLKGRRRTYRMVNSRWQAERAAGPTPKRRVSGTGVSPGLARGIVKVIKSEREFDRLLPGEIIACPHSNPAWTPLFTSAAAVIAETGGVTSHAAIVAREYGIPAVMGLSGILRILKDGDRVTVDGDHGVVEILKS
jgi:pyruvate,water dikinase